MVIETDGLTKIYGKKTGCRDVSIAVEKGRIFGFLGPNGAGKSTFVKMIVGLLLPTSGKAEVLGKPVGDVGARAAIGYLPETFRYQEWMTGVDLLSFHASLYKMDKNKRDARIDEVLDLVRLKGKESCRIGTYSKGMQQRIGLASAMLNDPDLLILDEPSSALDPIGRKEIRDIIRSLKRSGKTIFLNSHLLGEVETLCDSVAFINKGLILKQGPMTEILNTATNLDIRVTGINEQMRNRIRNLDPKAAFEGDIIRMRIGKRQEIPDIAAMFVENGGKLYELTPHGESLEDIFIGMIEGGGE